MEAKKEAPKQPPHTEPKADDTGKAKEPVKTPTTADVPSKPAENNAADNKPVATPNIQKQIEKLKKKKVRVRGWKLSTGTMLSFRPSQSLSHSVTPQWLASSSEVLSSM